MVIMVSFHSSFPPSLPLFLPGGENICILNVHFFPCSGKLCHLLHITLKLAIVLLDGGNPIAQKVKNDVHDMFGDFSILTEAIREAKVGG